MTTVAVPFCGAGGSSLGVHAALPSARVVGIDTDPDACRTHAQHWPTVRADVATMALDPFSGIDGLWLSPPCQAFSMAGRRAGIDHLSALLAWCETWKPGDPAWTFDLDPKQYRGLEQAS